MTADTRAPDGAQPTDADLLRSLISFAPRDVFEAHAERLYAIAARVERGERPQVERTYVLILETLKQCEGVMMTKRNGEATQTACSEAHRLTQAILGFSAPTEATEPPRTGGARLRARTGNDADHMPALRVRRLRVRPVPRLHGWRPHPPARRGGDGGGGMTAIIAGLLVYVVIVGGWMIYRWGTEQAPRSGGVPGYRKRNQEGERAE